MTLEDILAGIFRSSLDLDDSVQLSTLKYRQIDKWDSTAHMELMAAIEERFDIMIDNIDVIRINSFEAAVRIIGTKYVQVEA